MMSTQRVKDTVKNEREIRSGHEWKQELVELRCSLREKVGANFSSLYHRFLGGGCLYAYVLCVFLFSSCEESQPKLVNLAFVVNSKSLCPYTSELKVILCKELGIIDTICKEKEYEDMVGAEFTDYCIAEYMKSTGDSYYYPIPECPEIMSKILDTTLFSFNEGTVKVINKYLNNFSDKSFSALYDNVYSVMIADFKDDNTGFVSSRNKVVFVDAIDSFKRYCPCSLSLRKKLDEVVSFNDDYDFYVISNLYIDTKNGNCEEPRIMKYEFLTRAGKVNICKKSEYNLSLFNISNDNCRCDLLLNGIGK